MQRKCTSSKSHFNESLKGKYHNLTTLFEILVYKTNSVKFKIPSEAMSNFEKENCYNALFIVWKNTLSKNEELCIICKEKWQEI